MGKSNFAEQIRNKETYLGIEFGSTRIKAVLTGADHTPIASGSYDWENQYEDGIWTYHLDMIWRGLKECYRSLREEVGSRYGVELEGTKAIGISAMMHGYLAFDEMENFWCHFVPGEIRSHKRQRMNLPMCFSTTFRSDGVLPICTRQS